MLQVAKVQNAERMMIRAESSHDGLSVSFADGLVSFVPWDNIEEIHNQSDVDSIEFNTSAEVVVRNKNGRMAEIPWDFARHFGDARV